ncbi:MAG: DUF3592 domain-containing protein [Gemmatimonadota bacterium]
MLLAAGALAFLFGLRAFGASFATTRWPFTPGRITRSMIVDSASPHFQFEYQYILGGHLLHSRRITNPVGLLPGIWPERAPGIDAAESLAGKYPVGKELPVFYDPGDVREAVLKARLNWFALVPLAAGMLLVGAGVKLLRQDWWPAT